MTSELTAEEFCAACPKCGGLTDSYPDCLGDGDYSPDGHEPSCELCATIDARDKETEELRKELRIAQDMIKAERVLRQGLTRK